MLKHVRTLLKTLYPDAQGAAAAAAPLPDRLLTSPAFIGVGSQVGNGQGSNRSKCCMSDLRCHTAGAPVVQLAGCYHSIASSLP